MDRAEANLLVRPCIGVGTEFINIVKAHCGIVVLRRIATVGAAVQDGYQQSMLQC